MHRILTTLIVIAVFFMAGCGGGSSDGNTTEPQTEEKSNPVFPVSEELSWHYNDDQQPCRFDEPGNADGADYHVLAYPSDSKEYYVVDGHSVALQGFFATALEGDISADILFDKAVTLWEDTATPDTSLEVYFTGRATLPPEQEEHLVVIRGRVEYRGVAAVEVPLGKFSAHHVAFALDITIDIGDTPLSVPFNGEMWLADRIGIVKKIKNGVSLDLTDLKAPDSDADGVVDPLDAFPLDPSQHMDTDNDGGSDDPNPEAVANDVKVLFAIDCSLSMQASDPGEGHASGNRRIAAVRRFIEHYNTSAFPGLSFGIILWSSSTLDLTLNEDGGVGFTRSTEELNRVLNNALTDTSANYIEALKTIRMVIERDIMANDVGGPVDGNLSRTQYIVHFLSDGTPNDDLFDETPGPDDPPPSGGTGSNDPPPSGGTGTDDPPPSGGTGSNDPPPSGGTGSDDPPPSGGTGSDDPPPSGGTASVEPPENAWSEVDELARFAKERGVGELTFNTFFLSALFRDADGNPYDQQEYVETRLTTENVLLHMSRYGNGIYHEFITADEIDFIRHTNIRNDDAP